MHYYSVDSIREIESQSLDLDSLMIGAGKAIWDAFIVEYPQARVILVLLGKGNNAGDACVFIKHALAHGLKVECAEFVENINRQDIPMMSEDILKLNWVDLSDNQKFWDSYDVIIDGGFGIGGTRLMGVLSTSWIQAINQAHVPVVAIDIPSGLCSRTGLPLGCALVADMTVTLMAKKTGFIVGQGLDYVGKVVVNDLGEKVTSVPYELRELKVDDLPWGNFRRRPTSHKGSCGKVVVIGGYEGLLGAAILSAESALKMGAGYVKLWTLEEHVKQVPVYCPDIVVCSEAQMSLSEIISWADTVLIGPGLGRTQWGEGVFDQVVACCHGKPLVLDADALYWLAKKKPDLTTPTIITPHAGEAGMLMGEDASFVQKNRQKVARKLTTQYSACVVLKGAGTLISYPSDTIMSVCCYGHSAMSTAGMGDVLAGMVVSSISQLKSVNDGVAMAVTLHSKAGEDLAVHLSYGLMANDVVKIIPKVLNELVNQ
ncbi:MAG TPA: NAD(P)H-hydrate dehydratase [Gammaproteobacteria bacterium]|nr:NAD(P)H-hydrate dehydratase [Gammaproteobacteria bacterium]